MLLRDISFQAPEENIIFDEVLLSLAESGRAGESLRFWESQKLFIVLGRICKEEDDLNCPVVKMDGIPVLRRASGGGTVIQGPGCLNYSLILSKENNPALCDLRKSYELILTQVIKALKYSNVSAAFFPICDIALLENHKKISGNAQKRGRKFILHHGTILYDFDLSQIERYLKIPTSIPDYRKSRSHLDFVTNVPLTVLKIKEAFKKTFFVDGEENFVSTPEQEYLTSFLKNKNPVVD